MVQSRYVRNVNQPKISSNETFPESSKGSIVAHLGKYWNNLICCHHDSFMIDELGSRR